VHLKELENVLTMCT